MHRPEDIKISVLVGMAPEAGYTIAIGEGIRESDGKRVVFVGDWTPMLEVAAAIRDSGEPVPASVPAYAVLA